MHVENIFLFVLCILSLTHAWTFVMVKDRDMVETTEVILEGKISSYGPALNSNFPATNYQVVVENILKGNEEINEATTNITITVLGGFDAKDENIHLHVDGAPQFSPGDHVLLFLVKHKGTWAIHHFALGAFHQVADEEGTFFAARSFDDRIEGKARNFGLFKEYIHAVLNKREVDAVPTYLAAPAGHFKTTKPRYNLTKYGNFYARWSQFDEGSSVDFQVNGYTSAIENGGVDQINEAMAAWNNEDTTTIWYRLTGNTTDTTGLSQYDPNNSIVWNDPNDEIAGSYSCSSGGTLAIGGWWTIGATVDFNGGTYNKIASGDVVVQDGIECWITGASDPDNSLNALLAHELGHTLGLWHSCGDSSTGTCVTGSDQDLAVMRSYIQVNRGPIPGVDDVNAIDVLYLTLPSATTSSTTASSTTGTSTTTGSSTTSSVVTTGASITTGSSGSLYFGSTLYFLVITIPQTSASTSQLQDQIASVLAIPSDRVYISAIVTPGKISGSTDISFYLYEQTGETSSYDLGNLMVTYVLSGNSILAQNGLTVYYIYLWYIPNVPGNAPATPSSASTPALEGAGPTSPTTATEKASGPNAAIIGGAVGGGVALVAIVGLTVVLIRRRQNKGHQNMNANFGY